MLLLTWLIASVLVHRLGLLSDQNIRFDVQRLSYAMSSSSLTAEFCSDMRQKFSLTVHERAWKHLMTEKSPSGITD